MNRAEDKPPKTPVEKLVLAATTRPLSLTVLGSGLFTSLGLGIFGGSVATVWAMGVLALGTAAYGALVGLDLTNERFVRKVVQGGSAVPEPISLPDPTSILSAEHRELYRSILAGLSRAEEIYAGSNDFVRDSLTETLARCHALAAEAGRAAQKGNSLTEYMRSERAEEIQVEVKALEASAAQASHERARHDYLLAAETKRQQLGTYEQIEALSDRVRAQLTLIDTTLDGVTARLIKVGATDISDAVNTNRSIATHLESMTTDMQVLETTVDEMIQELSL